MLVSFDHAEQRASFSGLVIDTDSGVGRLPAYTHTDRCAAHTNDQPCSTDADSNPGVAYPSPTYPNTPALMARPLGTHRRATRRMDR